MDGWDKIKIRDIFASSIPGDWGANGTPEDGNPVLRSTNFLNNGTIDYTDIAFRKITEARLNRRRINNGTILIEKSGGSPSQPAGRVVYCESDFNGTASNFIEIIKVKDDFSAKFIAYLLFYLYQIGLVLKYQQQTTGIINFKLNEYSEEIVFYPIRKLEQVKISAILATIDQAIEQTEAIVAKQQRIKTGLMHDLLTKGIDENGNIRTEATHEFKDSPLGHIPVGWEIKNLEHVTSHIIDCPHTTPSFVAGGVLVARTFNIKDSIFIEKNTSYVTEEEFKDRISRLEPQPGDIIFTREAPVGEAFLIPDGMRICLGQRTMLIRCDGKYCDPIYLIETLYSLEMRIRFDQMVGGTTNPHLNVADVRRLLVKIPPVEEQNRISNILEINRKALNDAQSQKCKLEVLKRGLMHDLLTGKVRVTDIQTPTLTPESL